jgi:regulator of protease activity HflC (stomatin/prohibitin superfamily)
MKSLRVLVLPLLLLLSSGCSKLVPVGYEGIKVNQWGGNRGVQDLAIRTGRVFYNPFSEDIFIYPIYLQNYQFTEDKRDESPTSEAIVFGSREGVQITADVGIGIVIPPGQSAHLLQKYRKDAYAIIHGPVRTTLWNAFRRYSEKMGVMEIMGARSSDLIDSVFVAVTDSLVGNDGLHLEYVSFLSRPRVPEEVNHAITATIVATQKSVEAQNMIVESTAKAEQRVAYARGESLVTVMGAQAAAQSTWIRAEADARANTRINASLTAQVIEWKTRETWNGVLPQVTSGAVPLMQLK